VSCDQAHASRGDILIVDDTPVNLRLLSKMLADQGYKVRPVADGALALAAAQAEPPDLVLLDIRMPEMDGYEVCERLKADARTHDIPIIFISALDATEDKVRAFAVGGVDYVTKPFQIAEVSARVHTHLALWRLQRQLQEANEKMERELALAGEVQAGFLSHEPPAIPGWELSVALKPARETSGDFYDFIALPDRRLGILIADVVDKGVAAALYMALSWTLIRTYAMQYASQPERVLNAVNRRILKDTTSSQFVTAFYGVLDPATGVLTYCNAGHCPPYVVGVQGSEEAKRLARTGIVLGVFEDRTWEQEAVQLVPGDVLVLYTDGISEAQNERGEFYGEDRLLEYVTANLGRPAWEIRDGVVEDVQAYVGNAPQHDDLTLAVLVRANTMGL
jgi:sigma-B regulation protein RsbU (phosphoserine phosphatase)